MVSVAGGGGGGAQGERADGALCIYPQLPEGNALSTQMLYMFIYIYICWGM